MPPGRQMFSPFGLLTTVIISNGREGTIRPKFELTRI
jgi:hypothetical protein